MRQFSVKVCDYAIFWQKSISPTQIFWTAYFALGKTSKNQRGRLYLTCAERVRIHSERVTKWDGLDIVPNQFPGKNIRSGALGGERSFDLIGTSMAFKNDVVMIVYGGWNIPDALRKGRLSQNQDGHLLGLSVKDGGSGFLDGNPAIMKFLGKADFCSPGARSDEAEKPEKVNCEIIELCGKDHTLLKRKAKKTPGLGGFDNLEHKYCVVTYGGIDNAKLRLNY